MPRRRSTARRAPTRRDAAAARHPRLAARARAGRARGGGVAGGRASARSRSCRSRRRATAIAAARSASSAGAACSPRSSRTRSSRAASTSRCTRPRTSPPTRRPGSRSPPCCRAATPATPGAGRTAISRRCREGARVGTASMRRGAQLRALRPDLIVESLRGNVDTRLRKRVERGLDGVVLAACGLDRLDLARRDRVPRRRRRHAARDGTGLPRAAGAQPRTPLRSPPSASAEGGARPRWPSARCAALLGGGCLAPVATHAVTGAGRAAVAARLARAARRLAGRAGRRARGGSRRRSPGRSPRPRSGAEARRSSPRCGRDGLPRRRRARAIRG